MRASLRLAALLSLLLLLGGCASVDAGQQMEDPLFGVSYRVSAAAFERFEADAALATLLEHPPYWIYAHVRSHGRALWLLNHHVVTGDDPASEHIEPAYGVVLLRDADGDRIVGTADHLFDAPDWLADGELEQLLADAAARYARAYGSRADAARRIARSAPPCLPHDPRLITAFDRAGITLPAACNASPASPTSTEPMGAHQ
jgi:hypothetical protein